MSTVFVTDWDTKQIVSFDVNQTSIPKKIILMGSTPMALFYSPVTMGKITVEFGNHTVSNINRSVFLSTIH
jgi:hypothetical protein